MSKSVKTAAIHLNLLAVALCLLAPGAARGQQSCQGTIDGVPACQFYVDSNYFAVLGRAPDWTGWIYWYWELTQNNLSYLSMTSSFLGSQEYFRDCQNVLLGKTYFVIGWDSTNGVPGGIADGTYQTGQSPNPASWCGTQTYSSTWTPYNYDFVTLL